ncbi:hypothetical protein Tco_0038743 [Tanacetum coccineum]
MVPGCSRAIALPKFGMHTYTSKLTLEELKEVIIEYCIPKDLHPRLPPPNLTINKLPSKYIRIYVEQLESLNINPTISLFRVFYKLCKQGYKLCKQGHWFSFEIKIDGRSRKCFKEADAARLAEIHVPLHPPPRHLLYVCGLTTAHRHPELSYTIKGPDGTVLSMDNFLQLPVWTRTIFSCSAEETSSPEQRARGSSSDRALSVTPLYHVVPNPADETTRFVNIKILSLKHTQSGVLKLLLQLGSSVSLLVLEPL